MTLSSGRALVVHNFLCGLKPTTSITNLLGSGRRGLGESAGSGDGVRERANLFESLGRVSEFDERGALISIPLVLGADSLQNRMTDADSASNVSPIL
jgi:hypothetical protein